jgi:hypothetical protein
LTSDLSQGAGALRNRLRLANIVGEAEERAIRQAYVNAERMEAAIIRENLERARRVQRRPRRFSPRMRSRVSHLHDYWKLSTDVPGFIPQHQLFQLISFVTDIVRVYSIVDYTYGSIVFYTGVWCSTGVYPRGSGRKGKTTSKRIDGPTVQRIRSSTSLCSSPRYNAFRLPTLRKQ